MLKWPIGFGLAVSIFKETALAISSRGDWRKAELYHSHLGFDCAQWAAEWLRRNPKFLADLYDAPCRSRVDASLKDGQVRIISCAEKCPVAKWGLRCCRKDDWESVFLWLPEFYSQVLTVDAEVPEKHEDGVDLRRCSLLKAVLIGAKQELNLLFSDNARTLQVVVRGASSVEERFLLRCMLRGMGDFQTKPLSLRRLCCLYKRDRLAKALYPEQKRALHWVKMIRAWDGAQSGACRREIGRVIYGEWAGGDGWDEAYRSRVQRLIRSANKMVDGGYLTLLR